MRAERIGRVALNTVEEARSRDVGCDAVENSIANRIREEVKA